MLNFVGKTKSIIGNAKVKCESMRITHTRNKSITQYMLDKPLKDVKNFEDLGGRPFNSWGAGVGDLEKNFLQALVGRKKLHAAQM